MQKNADLNQAKLFIDITVGSCQSEKWWISFQIKTHFKWFLKCIPLDQSLSYQLIFIFLHLEVQCKPLHWATSEAVLLSVYDGRRRNSAEVGLMEMQSGTYFVLCWGGKGWWIMTQ